ncbi:MAG: hypothetical protein H7274_05675 [Rhodoferax sp.]|nr:hypothetical protein [Rhodoferax sp.]
MAIFKPSQPAPDQKSADGRILERRVRVSDSGQFTVSMDAVRELKSFRRDVSSVAKIREKLIGKR